MRILALSDPHLALATSGKEQDIFGDHWHRHVERLAAHWHASVGSEDLVLVPGDISWAMRLEQAQADLDFLGRLPGHKILVKGNHDYWWQSISRVRSALIEGMFALQADAVRLGDVVIGGTRLWDQPGVSFRSHIREIVRPEAIGKASQSKVCSPEESARIFAREMGRLRRALQAMEELAAGERGLLRILATHYPTCTADDSETGITRLLADHAIDHAVFGHLHNVMPGAIRTLGPPGRVHYHLASADYLDFIPVCIAERVDGGTPSRYNGPGG